MLSSNAHSARWETVSDGMNDAGREVEQPVETLSPRPPRQIGLRLARSIMGVVSFLAWFMLLNLGRYVDIGPVHTLFIQFSALAGLLAFTERVLGLHAMEHAVSLRVVVALGIVACVVEALLLFGSTGWAGLESWMTVAVVGVGMTIFRLGAVVAYRAAVRAGVVAKTVIVVGPPSTLRRRVVTDLQALVGVRVVAVLPGDDFDALAAEIKRGQIDEVMLVTGEPAQLHHVVDGLEVHAVDVRLVTPSPAGSVERQLKFRSSIQHARVLQHQRLGGSSYLIKRLMDVVGSICGLVLLSPLLIGIAIAIKLDSPGPVLFKQVRFGQEGREFLMWKYRSMRADASDHAGSRLTTRNDDRVTRVGAFLRATSLDEVPQLVNVLRGELSLVGPRPHPSGAKAGETLYDDLIQNFMARYRVRPGLTGLAQCNGLRGNTDTEEKLLARFAVDMEYIETWTILGDIKILLKTVAMVLARENAY
jgi:exopolysaccharide biosynthesis polyprenyl glycosylphosphotransferase